MFSTDGQSRDLELLRSHAMHDSWALRNGAVGFSTSYGTFDTEFVRLVDGMASVSIKDMINVIWSLF